MRAFLIPLLALGVCAQSVSADEADIKTQARAHFRAGTAFYEAGDYVHAIEQYREAYKLLPLPDLLFNLGQAYRLEGDANTAADYYRRYLAEKPTGPVSDEARAHLSELEVKQPPPIAAPPRPSPPLVTSPPPAPTPAPMLSPATPPVITKSLRASPAPHKAPVWKRGWLWGVIGGVAAAGIAIGVGVGVGTEPHRIQPTDGTVRF